MPAHGMPVAKFRVRVDLNDCEQLYDSLRGRRLVRPSSGWDWATVSQQTRIARPSEQSETRVKITRDLLQAHRTPLLCAKEVIPNKMGFQGLHVDDYTAASSRGLPSAPAWLLPVFQAGDTVRGLVQLHLLQPVEAHVIKIRLRGGARTKVRSAYGKSVDPGSETYIHSERVLWRNPHPGSKRLRPCCLGGGTPTSDDCYPAGEHWFPFEFRLPQVAPPSLPIVRPSPKSKELAFLGYCLQSIIDTGRCCYAGSFVVSRPIWVDRCFDVSSVPISLEPFTVEREFRTGALGTSGPVICTVSLPCRAITRSGVVPVVIEIENRSRKPVLSVSACIQISGKFKASGPGSFFRRLRLDGRRVGRSEYVPPGLSPRYTLNVPLDFSSHRVDTELLPAGPFTACSLINFGYVLNVHLRRPGIGANFEVDVPLLLGSVNQIPRSTQT